MFNRKFQDLEFCVQPIACTYWNIFQFGSDIISNEKTICFSKDAARLS